MDKLKSAGEVLNRGAKLLASGKINLAIKSLEQATHLDPQLAAAHFDLAIAYSQKGESAKAISELEKCTRLKPSDFEAQNWLGHLYMTQGDTEKALAPFLAATAANPLSPEGFYNLGVCRMQRQEYDLALKSYFVSLKLFPKNSPLLNNVGVTLEKMGRLDESLTFFKKAIKIDPKNAMAYANIGAYYIYLNSAKAKGFFEKALEIDPNMDSASYNLGVCLRLLGNVRGSIAKFQKAISLNPDFSPAYGQLYHQLRESCDWSAAKLMENRLRKLSAKNLQKKEIPAETLFVSVIYDDNPSRNLKLARAWSSYINQKVVPYKKEYDFGKKPHLAYASRGKKIRIGYLSNDFKNHATSHLILGLLRCHNRQKFDIYTYSYGENDRSFYRREIEKITRFRDILLLSHQKAADLINRDKIDILVDLKGHTTNSRLEIAALRPAPVQINYLGFPGTSGAPFFDYFITDAIVTPKKQIPYFKEKLIFLPYSYQVNDNRQKIAAKKQTRRSLMLPEKGFLFCSFNQPYKIGAEVFSVWMRILKKVPESFLCLLAKNEPEIANLQAEAAKRGVNPQRLIFSLPLRKDVHLARLALCDLALDTFICNGHTTTSDALWAGLPVLALLGKHFASRVSASLLSNIGLSELICKTPREYEQKAIALAKNPQKLNAIRSTLNANRLTKPLFNTQLFRKHLETAYQKVWQRHLENKKPISILIKP